MPLTPSETSRILDELGHRPKKKLGQNFLVDGNIVRKSIAMANLPAGIPVVEIGPGLGTLTRQLLANNHSVYAVEIDTVLAESLEKEFSPFIESKQFNLYRGDAVKFPVANLPGNIKEFAVVANLPYAISSPWMESLLNQKRIPIRMVLMLQKEAVVRMSANHGGKDYNALSIFLKSSFKQVQTHPVPRQCFFPIPGIDSVLVQMERLEKTFLYSASDRSLIRRIFTQRRKQISSLVKKEKSEIRDRLESWLLSCQIAGNLRPEQISADKWQALAEN